MPSRYADRAPDYEGCVCVAGAGACLSAACACALRAGVTGCGKRTILTILTFVWLSRMCAHSTCAFLICMYGRRGSSATSRWIMQDRTMTALARFSCRAGASQQRHCPCLVRDAGIRECVFACLFVFRECAPGPHGTLGEETRAFADAFVFEKRAQSCRAGAVAECHGGCACGPTCGNRVSATGACAALEVGSMRSHAHARGGG